jgi:CubicO group peptidase (beta-lactamase class C family)
MGQDGHASMASAPLAQVRDHTIGSVAYRLSSPVSSRRAVTRREWLSSALCGLALSLAAPRARGQVSGQSHPSLRAYDELMHHFMAEHKPPGAALAVTYKGRLVYARGFGHANRETRQPVTPSSLFRIASLSKPFTSAAIMRLVERGKLKLHDRVFSI